MLETSGTKIPLLDNGQRSIPWCTTGGALGGWVGGESSSFWKSLGSRVRSLEGCWVLLSVVVVWCYLIVVLFHRGLMFFFFLGTCVGCFVMFFIGVVSCCLALVDGFLFILFDVVFTFSDIFWCLMSFYPFYHHCCVLWKFTILFREHSEKRKNVSPFWESFFQDSQFWGEVSSISRCW